MAETIKSRFTNTFIISALAIPALAACQTVEPKQVLPKVSTVIPVPAAVPERDVSAAFKTLANSSVLDVDLHEPLQTIGSSCIVRPLAKGMAPASKLSAALEEAKSYSLAQKGVSLMVLKDGKIIHESYSDKANVDTLTDSYSMMKSVVGLMTGIAIDKGLIDSDGDPVGDYLAEWKDDRRGQIPLREFLTMSSGLKPVSFPDPSGDALKLLLSTDINRAAFKNVAQDEPGSIFRYMNVNSQIVGAVIDRAAQARGEEGFIPLLEKSLWCPLGNGPAKLWVDRLGGSPRYYAGTYSPIANWARIGELIRNDGRVGNRQIVSKAWIDSMIQPSPANPAYGKQVWLGKAWAATRLYSPESPMKVIHGEPYKADDVVFFDGFGGQRVYIIPSKGLTIVRTGFVNFAYDDSKIVNTILEAME